MKSSVAAIFSAVALSLVSGQMAVAGAPSQDELANATYQGVEAQSITLDNGRWEGQPFVDGGASRPSAGLVAGFRLSGDLDGDGRDEAVVLLWENSGGTGTFSSLVVMGRDGNQGKPVNLATAEIGDRVQVRAGRIVGNRIELDLVQQGPGDGACCPTALVTRVWTFDQGLTEAEPKPGGTLSLATLDGSEWQLTELGRGKPVSVDVTLAFKETQVGGKSGCNRYFSGVSSGEDANSLKFGPIGGTRMACPGEAMAVESRYLGLLEKVDSFSFQGGQLLLGWEDDGRMDVLVFAPKPEQ
jgi:heat shock protein HslJ